MKKTVINERFENVIEAFFNNENSPELSAVTCAGSRELVQTQAPAKFARSADKYFGYFKNLFSFVPGVLFLHFAVPSTIVFGFGLWGLFWFTAGIFMVWAGIGDLKNKKHLLLPLSVIMTALIFALPFGLLPAYLLNYYIYLYIGILPLLFTAPILTKGLLEKNERSKDKGEV